MIIPPEKKAVYALVDCNNFYASCERAFNPKLQNTPIVVLSNNDGCVIARSAEAKALGIPMGAPAFKFRKLFKKHNVKNFSSNFVLYGDMSRRVMETVSLFSPDIEIYSIDEIFLGLDRLMEKPEEIAEKIRNTVFRWTGIPVSVGIGATKTLAKAANHIAKKNPAHRGVFSLLNHPDIDSILESIDVGDIWGIGRKNAAKLKKRGVFNALEFCRMNRKLVRQEMTVGGLRTLMELNGISCIPLEETLSTPKSIVCSRTFKSGVTDREKLAELLSGYVSRTAERLRAKNCVASFIQVFVITDRFRPEKPQYSNSGIASPITATSHTPEMIRIVKEILNRIYRPGYEYRKAGVMLYGIEPEHGRTMSFFELSEPEGNSRNRIIMETIDRINSRWGDTSIRFAAEGTKSRWEMRQNHLSRRFTTDWKELPVAKTGK